MRPPGDAPRLRDYGRMLWRWGAIILCATLLSAGAFAVAGHWKKPKFVASTQVFAVVAGDAGVPAAFQGGRGAVSRMSSYGQLATSALVATRTVDDLKLTESPAEFSREVSVVPVPQTALLNISVADADPTRAVQKVNALTRNLVNASQELEWGEAGPSADLVPVDDAISAQPVAGASRLTTIGIGAGIGLLLSCVVLLGYEIARGRLLDRTQVGDVVDRAAADNTPVTSR